MIGMMSSVRTRCAYRGVVSATYYEPNAEFHTVFSGFVRITNGRGQLLTEIAIARKDGSLHVRHDDRSWWRPSSCNTVQQAVQVYACRYGILG